MANVPRGFRLGRLSVPSWVGAVAIVLTAFAPVLPGGRSPAVASASPSPFVRDSFSQASPTPLDAHVGEVGAIWTKHPDFPRGALELDSNGQVEPTPGTTATSVFYASGLPATSEYNVESDIKVGSLGGRLGVIARASTTARTWYLARYDSDARAWELLKVVNGVATSLGSYPETLTPGATYHLEFQIRNDAKTVYVDGIQRIVSTDNSITTAGRVGIQYVTTVAQTSPGTFLHLDNFVATDAPASAPSASANSQTTFPSLPEAGWTAAPAGPQSMPCHGIALQPGDPIQPRLSAAPGETTFCLQPGLYRLPAALVPKSGDVIIGQPGTILSGARDVTSLFHPSGALYVAHVSLTPVSAAGVCRDQTNTCTYANDVFFDNAPLRRATSVEAVSPGAFYIDYRTGIVYIGSNPAGHRVELSMVDRAFRSAGLGISDVTIKNLTVEKFATPSGGAIQASAGWTVEDCTVTLNHRAGIEGGLEIRNNALYDNGQLGYIGYGLPALTFSNNIVTSNNYAGFAPGWEAGGVKLMKSTNVIVSNNYVHDNAGVGLWADTDNFAVLYDHNTVNDNLGPGIFYEAGGDVRIINNLIRGNGFDPAFAGWLDGAGIVVNSSDGVEIAYNDLVDNRHGIGATQTPRGVGPRGPRILAHLWVHDNIISMDTSGAVAGVVTSYPDPQLFVSRTRFDNNSYYLCPGSIFSWLGPKSPAQWVDSGNDITGTFAMKS